MVRILQKRGEKNLHNVDRGFGNRPKYSQNDALCELIERKYKDKLNTKKDADKMMSALLRKGYSYSDIKDALSVLEIEIKFTEEL